MEGENELSASPRADEILNLDEEEQGDWENICMVTESAIDQKQNKTRCKFESEGSHASLCYKVASGNRCKSRSGSAKS